MTDLLTCYASLIGPASVIFLLGGIAGAALMAGRGN